MRTRGRNFFSVLAYAYHADDRIRIKRTCYSLENLEVNQHNNKKRSHTQLDSRKQVIAFQDRVITINIKEAQHPLKMRKTSNRQIQYNVENFDKIHASSSSVRNWSSQ